MIFISFCYHYLIIVFFLLFWGIIPLSPIRKNFIVFVHNGFALV